MQYAKFKTIVLVSVSSAGGAEGYPLGWPIDKLQNEYKNLLAFLLKEYDDHCLSMQIEKEMWHGDFSEAVSLCKIFGGRPSTLLDPKSDYGYGPACDLFHNVWSILKEQPLSQGKNKYDLDLKAVDISVCSPLSDPNSIPEEGRTLSSRLLAAASGPESLYSARSGETGKFPISDV